MPSAGDLALAARDPGLPDLATVLDAEALTALVAATCAPAEVVGVRPVYVRYKPGTSCIVGCRIDGPAGAIDGYVQIARDPAKLEKSLARVAVAGDLGPGIAAIGGVGGVLHVYPNDAALPVLQRLGDDDERHRLWQRVLPDHEHLWTGALDRLSYKPQRRRVIRLHAPAGSVVIRFHGEADFEAVSGSAKRLNSRDDLRIAEWLRRSTRHHVTALEWLEGTPLLDILRGDAESAETSTRVGAALAALHGQTARLEVDHTPANRCSAVERAIESAVVLLPALETDLRSVFRYVCNGLAEHAVRCVLHGDLAPDQVLVDPTGIALLDLDRAGYGDPRQDLGSFVAALERLAEAGEVTQAVADRAADAALSGYEQASGLDVRSGLGAHVAAALALGLTDPFRTRSAAWPQRMAGLLARAVEYATERRTVAG